MRRRRRLITLRVDDDILQALNERVQYDREDGRTTSREGVIREILRNWARYLHSPRNG